MAEKATLLQKLPPVEQKTTPQATPTPESGASTGTSTGSEVSAESEISITPLQMATYGSFMLSFVLAGFAAVIIYRKALAKTTEHFKGCAKLLAAMLMMVSLHGFAATYVYTNYLNQEREAAPLSITVLVWVIFGAAIGYLGNRLIEKNAKLDTFDAMVDALTYACVFIFATLAFSDQVGPNIALSLALLALIAYIIPLSRFLIACKKVKFKRQLSDPHGRQFSLYGQVLLPVGIPTIALLFTLELVGPEFSLFCINIFTSSTVLAASAVMLISMKASTEQDADEVIATTPAAKPEVKAAPQIDPLVTELLAEEEMARKAAAEAPTPVPTSVPVAFPQAPSRKPERPTSPKTGTTPEKSRSEYGPRHPAAPKKPDTKNREVKKPTADAPFKIKAPAKPKKRF